MALLVPLAVVLLALVLRRRAGPGRRHALVVSIVLLLAIAAVFTELASLVDGVTRPVVTGFWVLVNVLLVGRVATGPRRRDARPSRPAPPTARERKARGARAVVLALVVLVLATTLFLGLVAPPNTWDSMTYHLARVAMWIQQGSVDAHATSIERQVYHPPLAEYAILHLQLLGGSDRLANTVQWMGLVVCVVLASLVARELGGSPSAQVLSAAAAATLPMGILQASSTQNDLLVAALCLAFAYHLLRLRREPSAANLLLCALCLGLALLTKGTGYLFCAAIGIVLGSVYLLSSGRSGVARAAGVLSLVALGGLALSFGHYARNLDVYGHPLSTPPEKYRVDRLTAGGAFAGIVRNAAMHLATRSRTVNAKVQDGVERLLGAEMTNPATTWPNETFAIRYSRHEDIAGNPAHLVLLAFALLSLFWAPAADRRRLGPYAVAVLLGGLLFAVLLKWQPWATRLHTPLFMLGVPLIALRLSPASRERLLVWGLVVAALFVLARPFVVKNESRPLVERQGRSVFTESRQAQYFWNRPELEAPYVRAMEAVRRTGATEVGLHLGGDDWEYPLWVLAGKEARRGEATFRHVDVGNATRALAAGAPWPSVVVTTRPERLRLPAAASVRWLYRSPPISVVRLE